MSASFREKFARHGSDLHDLFLIDDDAVRVFQNAFQKRCFIGDLIRVIFPLDEFIHHAAVQGAGPVQGDERHDIVEFGRLELRQKVFHTAAFKLEHARRVAGGEELEGLFVIEGDVGDFDVDTLRLSRSLTTLSMRVSVSRPRKSILMRPIFSMIFM